MSLHRMTEEERQYALDNNVLLALCASIVLRYRPLDDIVDEPINPSNPEAGTRQRRRSVWLLGGELRDWSERQRGRVELAITGWDIEPEDLMRHLLIKARQTLEGVDSYEIRPEIPAADYASLGSYQRPGF